MLKAEGLHKRYGQVAALRGFDLQVAAGEIVGLVGHNGAGKTTFVDMVAGLIRPDSGRISVGGIDVVTQPASARAWLGIAPQEIALYLSTTPRRNLRLFGGLAGLRRGALARAIAETAEAMNVTAFLDRPVGLLSGGQRRRVQAAAALLHRPPLLLLDEPTAGADPATREALLAAVRQRADEGTAVCYTTHYLPELEDLGATIAVVAQGRVIARGRQAELLAGVPGELRITLADGEERVILTVDPSAELAGLVREGFVMRAVDIRRPSLDDLYRSLEANRAVA
jgi:ABC-2 type transport system ATP-binding protein